MERLKSAFHLCIIRTTLWFVSLSNHFINCMLCKEILAVHTELRVWVFPVRIISEIPIVYILCICNQPCPTSSLHFEFDVCLSFSFHSWRELPTPSLPFSLLQEKKSIKDFFLDFYYCLKFQLKREISVWAKENLLEDHATYCQISILTYAIIHYILYSLQLKVTS